MKRTMKKSTMNSDDFKALVAWAKIRQVALEHKTFKDYFTQLLVADQQRCKPTVRDGHGRNDFIELATSHGSRK